jgi:hypothetical protein
MSDYNFTLTLKPYGDAPDLGVVKIDPQALYGYWERRNGMEGGGLWFAPQCDPGHATATGWQAGKPIPGAPLELTDYDGAFDIPKAVKTALVAAGFYLDEIMLAD